MEKTALHIIVDILDYSSNINWLYDSERAEFYIQEAIRENGFQIIASTFHSFVLDSECQSGYTGMIILAESHVSIHTWPEERKINLDVFVCSYTKDNQEATQSLAKKLLEVFGTNSTINYSEIQRY